MASYTIGPFPSTGTSGDYYQGRVDLTETVNVAANSSTIAWAFRIWATQVGSQSQYHYANGNTVTVTINGVQVYGGYPAVDLRNTNANNPQTLASGSVNVPHNDDGSKVLPVTAVYSAPASATVLRSITVSGTQTLTYIPRATPISSVSSSVNIGSAPSISWTPESSSYGYKLTYSIGTWTYTTGAITPNRTSSYTYNSYSIPAEVANQITTSTSGTATITLTTYGDTACTNQMGSSSATTTLVVPNNSTYNPSVSMSVSRSGNSGSYNFTGRTVFTITLTFSDKYSATHSYTFTATNTAGQAVYTASGTENSKTLTVGPFAAAGGYTFAVTMTDSRGRTATQSTSTNIVSYGQPSIQANITRGTMSGSTFVVDESAGGAARINYAISYTQFEGNSLNVRVIPPSGSAQTFSSATGTAIFNNNYGLGLTYTFTISVYDSVIGSSNPVTMTLTLSPATYPIDFLEDATGMGVHKVATQSGSMQVGWNVDIYGGNHLRTMNDSGQVTGDFKPGSTSYPTQGLVRRTINFGGGAVNLTQQFGFNIREVVSVTPRGYAYPCWWYCSNGSTSAYTIYVYRIDGNSIPNNTEFAVVAIPE